VGPAPNQVPQHNCNTQTEQDLYPTLNSFFLLSDASVESGIETIWSIGSQRLLLLFLPRTVTSEDFQQLRGQISATRPPKLEQQGHSPTYTTFPHLKAHPQEHGQGQEEERR
jgi:hypothetical protein